MKKIIFMILILFLLSGCDATYNLTLDSNNFIENLEIKNNNKTTWDSTNPPYKEMINNAVSSALATDFREDKPESNFKEEGVKYYNIKKIDTESTIGVSYDHQFKLKEYKYSTILNNNSENFDYTYDNDKIIINQLEPINSFILYPELKNLTIQFKTNHKVIKNNADEVVDDIYYFYLNKNNYQNKKIILELSKDFDENHPGFFVLDKEGYFSINTLIAIYGILGLVCVSICGLIFIKVRKSNN